MKILYISHKNDCFIDKTLFDVKSFVDTRPFEALFEDFAKYSFENFDILLCHPESIVNELPPPIPTIVFSGSIVKTIFCDDGLALMPKELLELQSTRILSEFEHFGDLHAAYENISQTSNNSRGSLSLKTNNLHEENSTQHPLAKQRETRHTVANKRGPLLMLKSAMNCQSSHLKHSDIDLPYIPENVFNKLRQEISAHAETTDINGLPVPLCNFTGVKGICDTQRILLVDDEHQRGWSTVIGALLFGDSENVHNLDDSPTKREMDHGLFTVATVGSVLEMDDFSDLWNTLRIEGVDSGRKQLLPFDLILLDYRIKCEDPSVPPSTVSGTKIIKKLKQIDPSIPIIVITASENYKTFRHLFLLGILGYYAKPDNQHTDNTEQEFLNFCEMVLYAKGNAYWRNLWNIILWLKEERPAIRALFLSDLILTNLGMTLKVKNHCDAETAPEKRQKFVQRLVLKELSRMLSDGILFVYRRSRGIMFSKTILQEDEVSASHHTVEVYTWVLFRLSHISDLFYLSKNKEDKSLQEEDHIFRNACNICRFIRNLTVHPSNFAAGEEDLFIMVLALAYMLFEPTIPDDRLKQLFEHSAPKQQLSFDTAYDNLIKAYNEKHDTLIENDKDVENNRSEDILTKIANHHKDRTDIFMLHAAYLLFHNALSKDASNQTFSKKILLNLLTSTVSKYQY